MPRSKTSKRPARPTVETGEDYWGLNPGDKLNAYMPLIERLRGGGFRHLEDSALRNLLEHLQAEVPQIAIELKPDTSPYLMTRARVIHSPQEIANLADLGPPPKEACREAGRCNRPFEPAFYAGCGTELVLSELNARIDSCVAFLHFKPKIRLLAARVGALDEFRRSSGAMYLGPEPEGARTALGQCRLNTRDGACANLIDSYFASQFRQRGDYHVYRITSHYTQNLLEGLPDIDGLLYDSVNHITGSCFAFRSSVFYEKIRPLAVQIVHVRQDLGYGLFDYQDLRISERFSENGEIIWDDNAKLPFDVNRLCYL